MLPMHIPVLGGLPFPPHTFALAHRLILLHFSSSTDTPAMSAIRPCPFSWKDIMGLLNSTKVTWIWQKKPVRPGTNRCLTMLSCFTISPPYLGRDRMLNTAQAKREIFGPHRNVKLIRGNFLLYSYTRIPASSEPYQINQFSKAIVSNSF